MLAIVSKQTKLALYLFGVALVVFIPRSHMAGTCLGNHTFTAVSTENSARQKVWVVFILFVVPAKVFHHTIHHLPQLFFNYRRNYIGENLTAKLFYAIYLWLCSILEIPLPFHFFPVVVLEP